MPTENKLPSLAASHDLNQWKLVPVEPTETMVINGFESEPDECFSDEEVWEQYQEMSGCQQAAFRAKLCWAAMLAAAPIPPKPIYDEAKERELFEAYASTHYRLQELPLDFDDGEYIEPEVQYSWESWEARAKDGEVGHE